MSLDIEKYSYRLTVLLDENNMTQTQLAQKIGTSNVTICRYLNGERTPRLDVVSRIANVFQVSLDYLLGLADDKTIKKSSKNADLGISLFIKDLYNLDKIPRLSKSQIELIKKLLLANKDFILPTKEEEA